MSDNRVIPEAAVDAAVEAHRAKVEWIDRNSRDDYGREDELGMRAALEAAAPHLIAAPECDSCRHARVAAETRRDIAAISEALARGPRG